MLVLVVSPAKVLRIAEGVGSSAKPQRPPMKLLEPRSHFQTVSNCMVVQVALPELDGGIEPIVFAGRDSNTGKSHSLPDRIDVLCSRAIKWAK
jgi:hypothetical protein